MSGVVTAREQVSGPVGWSLAVQPRISCNMSCNKSDCLADLAVGDFAVISHQAESVSFVVWIDLETLLLLRT